MPLSRLENFLVNTDGNILYVNPSDLDATDSFDNKGNSLTRPFVSIQRALLEAARNHLNEVKQHRNWLLSVSDWTQGNDSPLGSSKKTEWQTYRQALRDLPATIAADSGLTAKALADSHSHSSWPTKPS